MKVSSEFAIVSIKTGRKNLAKHFKDRPSCGPCPERLRLPITITGYLEGIWGRDDGIDQEFGMIVETVTTENETPAHQRISENDYFATLVSSARREAEKAIQKFPQPNYVTLKIAEEAGEVVRGAVHFAEGRMPWEEVEAEIIQLLAMLIRFITEGDEINGIRPPVYAARAAPDPTGTHDFPVTREEAVKFLNLAIRNWEVQTLSEGDVNDVAMALSRFLKDRADLAAAPLAPQVKETPAPSSHVAVTAADVNSAFDPANEAFGMAFRDGFKEGWVFAMNPTGDDYDGACDAFKENVACDGMIMGEAFDAHRHLYFSMLPLAAIPEIGEAVAPAPSQHVAPDAAARLERILRVGRSMKWTPHGAPALDDENTAVALGELFQIFFQDAVDRALATTEGKEG